MENVQATASGTTGVVAAQQSEPITRHVTVADQRMALEALSAILRVFGHLPGAHFGISTIYPDRVDISCHDGLADFELWRETLGIPAQSVRFRCNDTTTNLTAPGSYAGASIQLNGFAPTPHDVAQPRSVQPNDRRAA